MKKLLSLVAVLAFVVAISVPVSASNIVTKSVITLTDEKPKKQEAKSETKSEGCAEKAEAKAGCGEKAEAKAACGEKSEKTCGDKDKK